VKFLSKFIPLFDYFCYNKLMNWLYISIIAYFLMGVANLGDKLIVSKYLSSPRIYAISVALLQIVVVILLPFFGEWPGWLGILLNFFNGGFFVLAIYFFYTALKQGETSRVVPTIDSITPILIVILSFFVFSERLVLYQFLAIFFLIIGGFLLSYQSKKNSWGAIKYILIASVAFAIFQVLNKFIYSSQPFLSAFIWMRVGGLIAVIPFLFSGKIRQELKKNFRHKDKNVNSKVVILTQVAGGIAIFLQNYAISLYSVSLVTALQGVKYLFLFIFIIFLSKRFVELKEDWGRGVIWQKVGGVGLVVVGLVLLVM